VTAIRKISIEVGPMALLFSGLLITIPEPYSSTKEVIVSFVWSFVVIFSLLLLCGLCIVSRTIRSLFPLTVYTQHFGQYFVRYGLALVWCALRSVDSTPSLWSVVSTNNNLFEMTSSVFPGIAMAIVEIVCSHRFIRRLLVISKITKHCYNCGYEITTLKVLCPECGKCWQVEEHRKRLL
jgi:hypothetical protein